MQYTENYQFRKPVIGIDVADVKDINFNSDRADTLIHNTQISLAPAYDLTKTYDTGDVVMYETLMYKCKADNTTGAWDASKWERTTAGEEGSGGGGGSSVVPNPQGTPTETLNTIGIDGTIFDIAGSGGGGGLERTLLWDYVTDNNNVIPYGLYTETLHDDIDNYDFIVAEIVSASGDLSASGWEGTNLWTIDVNALDNTEVQNYLNYTSFGERSSRFYIKDTTFQKTTDNQANTNGLVRVYGLKWTGGGRTEDVLFEKPYLTANPNTITLNHAFTDYDEIQFWTVKKDDRGYYDYLPINIVPVEYLTDAMAGTMSGRTNVINISGWQPMSQYFRISVTSASELAVVVNNNNLLIRKIVGIKY